ncbi:MAG: 4-(cytidine 5'-diphospho)-2-C-methyl-D-erythritol kinase [Fuerstiella sp.]
MTENRWFRRDASGCLHVSSRGKLNLFLEVLGRRDDGFHELETVMVRCSLADTLTFRRRSDDQIRLTLTEGSVNADSFPLDDSNLIVKAAKSLQQEAALNLGADIRVHKRIPSEAGLAGGSSNAAFTLLALRELWNASLTDDDLHQLAAELGSDINFFVANCRAARCTGRGETVQPLAWNRRLYAVLARPARGNSTPEIFRRLQPPNEPRSSAPLLAAAGARSKTSIVAGDELHAMTPATAAQLSENVFNRLTEVARQINPAMSDLLDRLERTCGVPAHMTGSGSTCFVLTPSHRQARIWHRKIRSTNNAPFTALVEL